MKIVVNIKGKEIKLNYEEAKDLYFELDEVFGEKIQINSPVFEYDKGFIYDKEIYNPPWTITCGSETWSDQIN